MIQVATHVNPCFIIFVSSQKYKKKVSSSNISVLISSFPVYILHLEGSGSHKIKVFSWLLAHRKISTGDVLQRSVPFTSLSPNWCTLCRNEVDTIDHYLLSIPLPNFCRIPGLVNFGFITSKFPLGTIFARSGLGCTSLAFNMEHGGVGGCMAYLEREEL